MNSYTNISHKKRILIISPNWIGDAVMAQPLLALLHQQLPEQVIDVMAPSWTAPIWRATLEVDKVLETNFQRGQLQLRARWTYARYLRQFNYQEVYVLPNTFKFALIPWLARIPRRIGYKGEMRYGLLNVIHYDDKSPRPMIPFYAALAYPPSDQHQQIYLPTSLPRPSLSINVAQGKAVLTTFKLLSDQLLIVLNPGAEFGSAKRWPSSHFAELGKLILARWPSAQIVLLGSAKDKSVCKDIEQQLPQVHNLAGLTTLEEAMALIANCHAIISNDSGLLHIASALNRPLVAVYGPTDPMHAPPFSDKKKSVFLSLECAPCQQRECPLQHHLCMRGIPPAMVWSALRSLRIEEELENREEKSI